MRLQEMDPKLLIRPSWLQQYEEDCRAIWWELVRLNHNLFILGRVAAFPFHLFDGFIPLFWRLAFSAFFETSLLIISKLTEDGISGTLTLRKFKNEIMQNLQEDRYKNELARALKAQDFERTISLLEPRVKQLRHNYLAHFNRDWNVKDPTPEQVRERGVRLSDLQTLRDRLNSLFELLCFGDRRGFLTIEYHPDVVRPPGSDPRTDIEVALDNIARDSAMLNMPERRPEIWPLYRERLSEEDLGTLNRYRVKFGVKKA
jgi:hypothetical protein